MRDTAGEARTNLEVTFSYGPQHMDVPVLTDQQELIYISFVRTLDTTWKICREQWMIGTDGERESGKFVLLAQLDDNFSENTGK